MKFGRSEVVEKKEQNGDGYMICYNDDVYKPH
jgi:hypothetical protein